MKHRLRTNAGFTIIELLVIVVLVGILATLITLTYGGVKAKNRNATREAAIDTIQIQLETYYAGTSMYPSLTNLNNPVWRSQHLAKLPAHILADPRWNKANKFCIEDGQAVASTTPEPSCYSYQVVAGDGTSCDSAQVVCAHYTLTASLEGGSKYVKSSLN